MFFKKKKPQPKHTEAKAQPPQAEPEQPVQPPELAEPQPDSTYPNLSLTRWGDPVLKVVDAKFKRAQVLAESKQRREAIAEFEACLALVVEQESMLFMDQYLNILIQIAHLYSELQEHPRAIEIQEHRLQAIRQEQGWMKKLPVGLNVGIRDNFPTQEHIAQSLSELGICYLQQGDREKSRAHFDESSKLYESLDRPELAKKNLVIRANLASHTKNWQDLHDIGLELTAPFDGEVPIDIRIPADHMRIQALFGMGELDKAAFILDHMIDAIEARNIEVPDFVWQMQEMIDNAGQET